MALPMSTKFGVEERGHVVVNHALCYVDKIKNRYATQPEVFEQFLKIMMDFHRESTPVPILYAQITQLFSADRDLVEEFQYFLPKTVVEAQAQAAPRLAAENAKIISKSLETKIRKLAPPREGKVNEEQIGGAGAHNTVDTSGFPATEICSRCSRKCAQFGITNTPASSCPDLHRVFKSIS